MSSQVAWLSAARRVCRASLRPSDMSINILSLCLGVTTPIWEWLCGIQLRCRVGLSPQIHHVWRDFLLMAKAGTGLPSAQGQTCKGYLHRRFSCSPLNCHQCVQAVDYLLSKGACAGGGLGEDPPWDITA